MEKAESKVVYMCRGAGCTLPRRLGGLVGDEKMDAKRRIVCGGAKR